MQFNENNIETKLDNKDEPVISKPKKKVNKKTILLVAIILVIIGFGVVYFLLLNKGDSSELLTEGDVKILEDKEIKVEENKINKELDSDQDGLPNHIEEILGTNFDEIDTDGDTYSDFDEVKNGYDPLNDKKYSEEEWEDLKEEIKRRDEGLYIKMFTIEKEKKTINLSQLIEACKSIEDENYKYACINSMCDLTISTEEKIRNCLNNDVDAYKDMCLMMIRPFTSEVRDNLIGNSYKDDYYLEIAKQTKDISMCEKISDDVSKKITCYYDLALSKNDSSICQKIDYNYLEKWCLNDSAKDFQICLRIEYGTLVWDEAELNNRKNTCIGVVTGNVEYCEKINEEDVKYSCYSNTVARKNDLSMCDKIESNKSFNNRDLCYMLIAIEREDSSLCDELGGSFREQCYTQTVTQNLDFFLCEKLAETEQSQCYLNSIFFSPNYFDIDQDEKGLSFCKAVEHEIMNKN